MLSSRKGPKPKIWVDRWGVTRKRMPGGRVWVKTKCEICKGCWRREGASHCIYNGPYWLPNEQVSE